MSIKEIDKNEYSEILRTREPLGKFYVNANNWFVGVDNTTGNFFAADFTSLEECINWLNDDNAFEKQSPSW